MLIREMRAEDRPRERFAESPRLASTTDLVAILLRTGRKGYSVLELAQDVAEMLENEGGLNQYEGVDWRDLAEIKGIGPNKAITICAAVELGRRLTLKYDKHSLLNLNTPDKVAAFFMEKLRHEDQEQFVVAYVNTKNRMLGYKVITRGNLNAAPVDVKEAMRWGIRFKAYGMILLHNHPSGYPDPSADDIEVTKAFAAAANTLDMIVLDHIVIGDGTYVSMHMKGYI